MTPAATDAAAIHEPIRTSRLLLRCWRTEDAPLLKEAIDSSLPALQQWMPWAMAEPSPLESLVTRLATFRRAFDEGRSWTYGVFDHTGTRVIGGSGLHPHTEPGRLEIGYWIRSTETGQGYATEIAAALADRAFTLHGAELVEIRCDARNAASAAVPRRLGFHLAATLAGDRTAPDGSPRDTMIWQLERPAGGGR